MQDREKIKALYCVLVGYPYEDDPTITLNTPDLWNSAEILFRFFGPSNADIGLLLLHKFGGALPVPLGPVNPPAPMPVPLGPVNPPAPAPAQKASTVFDTTDRIPILVEGSIPWTVEIDGVPTRWMLNYAQGDLPVTRGNLCEFQGNRYRASKIHRTHLHLTSHERKNYDLNLEEIA